MSEKVRVIRVRRLRTLPDNDLLLVERCPFCDARHLHGAGGKNSPKGTGDGERIAHCGGGQYSLREVA